MGRRRPALVRRGPAPVFPVEVRQVGRSAGPDSQVGQVTATGTVIALNHQLEIGFSQKIGMGLLFGNTVDISKESIRFIGSENQNTLTL